MIVEPHQRYPFFVYIVEAPAAKDIYSRRSEGDILERAVRLNGLPCIVKTVIDRETFEHSMSLGMDEARALHDGRYPILHISGHGNKSGIGLADGSILAWHELREYVSPINEAVSGTLVVCMSTCQGYAGTIMAMEESATKHPYFVLIGNGDDTPWADTAIAFATLYHLLFKGHTLVDAVKSMRSASGNDKFWVSWAKDTQEKYLVALRKKFEDTGMPIPQHIAARTPD